MNWKRLTLLFLAMVVAVIVAGCGGVGKSSVDPSGTWYKVHTQNDGSLGYTPTAYIMTVEKKTDNTYVESFKEINYRQTKSMLVNDDAYFGANKPFYLFSLPKKANDKGIVPEVSFVYEGGVKRSDDIESVNITERNGVIYLDESGRSFTIKDNQMIAEDNPKDVWVKVENGDGMEDVKKALHNALLKDLSKDNDWKIVKIDLVDK